MIATRHPHNPDPTTGGAGCLATGLDEPGVVFDGIEPLVGAFMFVGDTALHEALAAFHGLTPDVVRERLSGDTEYGVSETIEHLRNEVRLLRAENDRFRTTLGTLEWQGIIPAGEGVPDPVPELLS